jgi:hypothetical protein
LLNVGIGFWVVTPCWLAGRYQRFGGTYCLHLQGWRVHTALQPKRQYRNPHRHENLKSHLLNDLQGILRLCPCSGNNTFSSVNFGTACRSIRTDNSILMLSVMWLKSIFVTRWVKQVLGVEGRYIETENTCMQTVELEWQVHTPFAHAIKLILTSLTLMNNICWEIIQ